MREFLILKLQGPMQAWGEHTFEGFRPSANIPTKSGVLGLLGACLGIGRTEFDRLQQLADSIGMAVRLDQKVRKTEDKDGSLRIVKITDYHTIKEARVEYVGLKSHETIQTWREYLLDAQFTVAIWFHRESTITIDELERRIKHPLFTPYLGRRSCPLARPLFENRLFSLNAQSALQGIAPHKGTVYSEDEGSDRMMRVRDVPLVRQPRQFASRNLYIYGGEYVPE